MKQIEIIPSEQYSWANFKDFPNIDNSGIYFWSITYDKQQLIFYVGMTKNLKKRMNQHLESYTSGFYQVFDSKDFSRGIRKHVWIGKWRYDSALRNKDIDEETFNKALEEYELKKAPSLIKIKLMMLSIIIQKPAVKILYSGFLKKLFT